MPPINVIHEYPDKSVFLIACGSSSGTSMPAGSCRLFGHALLAVKKDNADYHVFHLVNSSPFPTVLRLEFQTSPCIAVHSTPIPFPGENLYDWKGVDENQLIQYCSQEALVSNAVSLSVNDYDSLFTQCNADVGRTIEFSLVGGMLNIAGQQNCIRWACNKLKTIGIELTGGVSFTPYLAVETCRLSVLEDDVFSSRYTYLQ
jgi:hypothetical protein